MKRLSGTSILSLLLLVAACAGEEPPGPEAVELYETGMTHLNGMNEAELRAAVESFSQCVENFPDDAPCQAGLALSYAAIGGGFNILPPEEAATPARQAAQRAVELDDQLAIAHLALGTVAHTHDWDWEAAERSYRRALELDPENLQAIQSLTILLLTTGRDNEASTVIERWRSSPETTPLAAVRFDYAFSGNADSARQLLTEAKASTPDLWVPFWVSANIEITEGNFENAAADLEAQIPLMAGDIVDEVALLGSAYGRMGRTEDAESMLARLDELEAGGRYVSPCNRAWVFAGLGDADKAIEHLEQGMQSKANGCAAWYWFLGYVYDPVRDDPRFQEVIAAAGLPG